MPGNPLHQWLGPAVAVVLVVALAAALLLGRLPARRGARTAARLRRYGVLCFYGAAANAVPRLAGAPEVTVAVCTAAGIGFAAASAGLLALAARRDAGTAPEGGRTGRPASATGAGERPRA
ncbi:hypothetical protein GCM10027168_30860 [Streptomyces capparidis]